MFASLAFSYARPVEKLSPCRPVTTIFHPSIWVSILGQLLIHLGCLMYIIQLTREAVSAEEAAVLDGYIPELDDESYVPPPPPKEEEVATSFWGDMGDGETLDQKIKFKPSLLNTVVFLVQTAQQVAVMAVNYKGRCCIASSACCLLSRRPPPLPPPPPPPLSSLALACLCSPAATAIRGTASLSCPHPTHRAHTSTCTPRQHPHQCPAQPPRS